MPNSNTYGLTVEVAEGLRQLGIYGNEQIDALPLIDLGSGNTILSGTGAPGAGLGEDGDFYIDTAVYDIWLKSGGTWGDQTSLIGPQGSPGVDGTDGINSTVTVGVTAPPSPAVGDIWVDTSRL